MSSAPSPLLQGAYSWPVPTWCCCMGLSHPRCRTLPFSLLIQRMFLLIQSFSRSLWVEALTFSMSTTLPNLVSPLNLLRMYSVSSSRLSMKILNNIGLTIDPCALLVTSHQLDGKPLITPFQPGSPSLSCPAIQYSPASFLHSDFLIFRKEKVQNPHGEGSKVQRSFEEKLGETESRVLNLVFQLLIRRAKNEHISFSKEPVTTSFIIFLLILEIFFKVASALFPQLIKMLLAQSTAKTLFGNSCFLTENLSK